MDTRSTYQEWILELVEWQVEMLGEEGNGRQRQPENSINTLTNSLTNDSFITEFKKITVTLLKYFQITCSPAA
jgi:hypothetical protein